MLSDFLFRVSLKAKSVEAPRLGACYWLCVSPETKAQVEVKRLFFPTALVCFGALAGAPDEAPDGAGFDALAGALSSASGASLAGVALGADADASAGVGCGAMPGAIPGALAGAVCDAPEGALQGAPVHAGLADEHCHVKTGSSADASKTCLPCQKNGCLS